CCGALLDIPSFPTRRSSDLHRENSTGYQKFAVNYLQKLRRSGWFKHYGLNECLEKSKKVLEWFYLPDGRLAPIGDTSAEPQRPEDRKSTRLNSSHVKISYAV